MARRLPHGLINWRYLQPGADEQVRLHRRLWWESGRRRPRALWCLGELWLWLRWVLAHGPLAAWRAVRRFGPEVAAREGIPLRRQHQRVLALALGWCIPPADVYRFRLYRLQVAPLDYVFDHETAAYHAWRSRPLGLRPASVALLQDKEALGRALEPLGIPVARTHAVAPLGDAITLSRRMDGLERVFCKSRSGNQGRGAFAAWRSAEGLAGRAFDGRALTDTALVEAAWRALVAADDTLLQPLLTNHPTLAPLAEGGDAITLRFISQWQGKDLTCLSATLEVPAGKHPRSGRPLYVILPIEPATGELRPFPDEALPDAEARARAHQLWGRVRHMGCLPGWPALAAASCRAHALFPDLWALAWDWVLTPDGPILLEGNTGWGVATVQMLQGGFLRSRN
ncbi:sugar-transfer associated ATP-grasp domain-containing protein [Azospirillum sp. SYSU D00513]|uniref:sugar-transfer associated ATP-grasp domain-containing protein n=1 Tax=Azospirillum sp. SYSU D00513 TaxID=2812561 RepID=UPI001A96C833|nr:sugar-transfer associated ATP-grasp domain-containing protein [Azospirillum sp. SYSU D00513]